MFTMSQHFYTLCGEERRRLERMIMSICLNWFPISGLGKRGGKWLWIYCWQNSGIGVIDTVGNKLVFIYEPNWYPFPFLEGSIVDSKHLIKIIESVIWKSSGRFERGKDGHSSHLDHLPPPQIGYITKIIRLFILHSK